MKKKMLILILLTILAVVGCSPDHSPTVQEVTSPIPTATYTPMPTETLASESQATVMPTTVLVETATPTIEPTPSPQVTIEIPEDITKTAVPSSQTPTPTTDENGKVYLGDVVLLDIWTDAPGCYHDITPEIAYSPTNTHFLVIPFCIEGDNKIFLFLANGTEKREITGPWDYLNGTNYEWSPDGQSFTYERIDSCCLAREDIPVDAPPRGLVKYDIATGEKLLIATPTPRPQ